MNSFGQPVEVLDGYRRWTIHRSAGALEQRASCFATGSKSDRRKHFRRRSKGCEGWTGVDGIQGRWIAAAPAVLPGASQLLSRESGQPSAGGHCFAWPRGSFRRSGESVGEWSGSRVDPPRIVSVNNPLEVGSIRGIIGIAEAGTDVSGSFIETNKLLTVKKDYIPSKDSLFVAWLTNFAALITANPVNFGLVAGDALTIQGKADSYDAAYTLAIDPGTRTPATVAAKDVARTEAEATVRPFAVQISLNDGVTDENKVAVGVTVRKTVPTPVPPPASAPVLGLVSQNPGRIQLSYRDDALPAGKSKPDGCIGLEIYTAVGTVAAVDPAQALYRGTITKSPNTLDFGAEDKGKIVVMWGRWVTRSGPAGKAQAGPWSVALQTIVV